MKISNIFGANIQTPYTKTEIGEIQTEELMEKAGLVRYRNNPRGYMDIMPLGQRVINNIRSILKEASLREDVEETQFSSLQSKDLLYISERYNIFSEFIVETNHKSLILSPTHEEYLIKMMKDLPAFSHNWLPMFVYQFDKVFRRMQNHQTCRGGLRNGEVLVYEGYGIVRDNEEMREAFDKFGRIFSHLFDKTEMPFIKHQLNNNFQQYLYETEKGLEDVICTDEGIDKSQYRIGENGVLRKRRVIDMAQIFSSENKFSECFNFSLSSKNGRIFPKLCSSGLGVYRTLYSIMDYHRDEKGIVWPKGLEPFEYAVIPMYPRDSELVEVSRNVYQDLKKKNISVVLDDRTKIKERKRSLEFIGIPKKIIVYKENGQIKITEESRNGKSAPFKI